MLTRMWNYIKNILYKLNVIKEPERAYNPPQKPGETYIDGFIKVSPIRHKTQGVFLSGFPKGAIVHHTAGRRNGGSIQLGKDNGYAYWVIEADGTINATHELTRYGWHAGTSSWPGLGSNVSKDLLGIEIEAAGKLKGSPGSWWTWWGDRVKDENVRVITKEAWGCNEGGAYEKFTPAQEQSLIKLLLWLKQQNPKVFSFDYVLFHSDVAPDRKNDANGSLSMPRTKLQDLLKEEYAKNTNAFNKY